MRLSDDTIRRLQAGDREALRMVYEATADKVFGIALGVLGNRSDAEDATQEVYLRLFAKAASFRFRASFTSWLYRLSVNHCLNLRRRRSLLGWLPLAETGSSRQQEMAEATRETNRLLALLDERARRLLALRELAGLSYREIAELTALPVGTVRSALSRARRELLRLSRRASRLTRYKRGPR